MIILGRGLAPDQKQPIRHRRHRRHSTNDDPLWSLIVMSSESTNHKASLKSYDTDTAATNEDFVGRVVTKVNLHKICNCPGSEPGKVNADIRTHLPGCHIRERLKSGRYTVHTSAIPRRITDGCSLGLAIGGEDF
jgi:hypothetical protein